MLSDSPLGDVKVGDSDQGDVVTALCFVSRAQTNGGYFGSAIKVTTGDLAAYRSQHERTRGWPMRASPAAHNAAGTTALARCVPLGDP